MVVKVAKASIEDPAEIKAKEVEIARALGETPEGKLYNIEAELLQQFNTTADRTLEAAKQKQ